MKRYLGKLKAYLSKQGSKLTKERSKMLREVAGLHKHFESESFLAMLNRKKLGISRPTFYRTLNLFVKAGIIGKSNLEDGRVIYEHLLGHGHHDHFVCTNCGRVIEFADPEIEKQQDKICKKFKFLGVRHQMQIFGLCIKCRD